MTIRGSSDASFTLNSLNRLFNLNLTPIELEAYASQLGSDCSFFIQNKATFAYGKGDQFKPLPNFSLKGYFILLIYPQLGISTQEAYQGVRPKQSTQNMVEIVNNDIRSWKESLKNDFEESIFPKYPLLKNIKDELYQSGALYASMSGSGSTMFGIFDFEPHNVLTKFSHFQCYCSAL
jgi:4-diphosphocytidyl-2-C-methyl-D-erythritol kinase